MREGIDAIYTPSAVATLIAGRLPDSLSGRVLDPAAGEGALLEAVEARFGALVEPLAIDLDTAAVRTLNKRFAWTVSHANTLSGNSRRASSAWRLAQSDLAVVLLNPPFSYRGNGGQSVVYGSFEGRVAPAIHFIATLLTELTPEHGFWAILPDGAMDADKHRAFWGEVRKDFEVSRLERFSQHTFPGARVSTSLVRLVRRSALSLSVPDVRLPEELRNVACTCVEIIRGRIPVHRLPTLRDSETVRFVHSTDLTRIRERPSRTAPAELSDEAPLLLLVRVGMWSTPAVIDIGRVVLSDCLIALRPRARASLPQLITSVLGAQAEFLRLYKGTGAKYLTLESVATALALLGWVPIVMKAGSHVASCACGRASNVSEVEARI